MLCELQLIFSPSFVAEYKFVESMTNNAKFSPDQYEYETGKSFKFRSTLT